MHLRSGPQDVIPVYENVHLIEAVSFDEAQTMAEKIGREQEAIDDPSLTLNDLPARMIFSGIRKIISVEQGSADPPRSGDELTYSVFNVADNAALKRLASGEEVDIEYIE